ncbi:MAG: hypothetical protein AB7O21_04385 [Gammaproteobacteria bacterium]
MFRAFISTIALVGVLCNFAVHAAEFAAPGGGGAGPRPQVGGDAHHAAEIARVQTGGRVLDVRPAHDAAQSAYEVRVLLDAGRVRRVVVDVNSGTVR